MRGEGNSALAVFLALSAGLIGVYLAFILPSAVFPELVFPRAVILADSPGQPREQMLVAVTRPLEEAAYGVTGTSLVRSTTSRGSAEIDVTFGPGVDPQTAFQALNTAVAEVRGQLPAGTAIAARLLTSGTFPIIEFGLSSRVRSLPELTDIATYDLIPAIHRIAGVYRAEVVGGKYREYEVRLDPAALQAYHLSTQDVVNGLAAANQVTSPGRLLDAHRMLLTVATAGIVSAADLARAAIVNVGGQAVTVGELGTVRESIREDYIRTADEQGPAVLLTVARQPNGNIAEIAAAVRALVAAARGRYPDVTFSVSYDQSAIVAESFRSVRDAIALGLGLAFVIVLVFTGSAASAGIALLVVSDCVAATVLVMRAAGLTFNMMTLGGLAAGIGLFIDDAIVMIEGIDRERAAGGGEATVDAGEAAVARARARLTRPLVAATLTAMVVFVPLAGLAGVTGTFFRALAVTLGAGLAISLLLALYVTPALERATASRRRATVGEGRVMRRVTAGFARVIGPFVARWRMLPVLGLVLLTAGVTVFLYDRLGTDYMPPMDEGAFILDYTTPSASTLPDTLDLLGRIAAILRSTPEVAAFAVRTGTSRGFGLTESNSGDFSVRLKPERRRGIDEIIADVRGRIAATVPGVRVEFAQVLQDFLGDLAGTPEPIEVKVFGADQDQIEGTAREVAAVLRRTPGLVDVFDGIVWSSPEEYLVVNSPAAARYRITPSDVQAALATVIEGTVATSVRAGDRLVDVRVRYPAVFHNDLGALDKVTLASPGGGYVPLAALVSRRWGGASPELERERLSPVVHVTARLEGSDLGSAVGAVEARLARLALPAGVHLELGGLYAEQQQAFRGLAMVMVVGLFGVFAVLLWEFARPGPAIAVLVAAVGCLSGGLAGLYLMGLTLNVSSLMGLIMVVGIAAKNGILLLDHAERNAAAEGPVAAVREAVAGRLRPILMTALATAAGMLPLALGLGAGAKIQQPLAVVVIGGLLVSIVLSAPLTVGIYLMLGGRDVR